MRSQRRHEQRCQRTEDAGEQAGRQLDTSPKREQQEGDTDTGDRTKTRVGENEEPCEQEEAGNENVPLDAAPQTPDGNGQRTASSDASTNVARASTRTAASRGATPKNASRSSTTRRTDRYDANAVGASTMRARKSTATASPRATTDKARAGGTHAGRDTASSREGDDGTCHALGGGRVGSRSVPRKPGGNVKCCRVKGRSFWSATNI